MKIEHRKVKLISFDAAAWKNCLFWKQNDKQMLRKINQFIHDIHRDPFGGLGKPEPLEHNLAGFWSR